MNVEFLMTLSVPAINRFMTVEPQPWTRKAILLELTGEIGSLAHLVQHWDGFKCGRPGPAHLADECSDVLFIILRLALSEQISLPAVIEFADHREKDATDLVLELCSHVAALEAAVTSPPDRIICMLTSLGRLARRLGVDLEQAHQREMDIAQSYFEASGSRWPRPQPLRHPIASLRLVSLIWKKRKSNR